MKENEREREIAGTRKPTLRSEFDSAYSDVIVGKSDAVNDAGEENVDVSAEEVNVDADVDLENADNDAEMYSDGVAGNNNESGTGQPSSDDFGRFCVGMVMRHKKYNYFCVVYGWDPICKASKVSHSSFFVQNYYFFISASQTTHFFPCFAPKMALLGFPHTTLCRDWESNSRRNRVAPI